MVTSRTHVDQMYDEFSEVTDYLRSQQPSFFLTADELFRKNLLVAAASYFEQRVKDIMLDFVRDSTDGNERLVSLVRDKITERGYHNLFQWDNTARNANRFWSSFGEPFNTEIREVIRQDIDLEEGIKEFIELGRDRNRLVHQDFGAFSLEKTAPEIYESYKKALVFVNDLPRILREDH